MSGADSLAELWQALLQPAALVELAVLLACLGLAWVACRQWAAHLARQATESDTPLGSIWLGRRGFDGLMFPLLALALALLARALMQGHHNAAVFRLAVPVLTSLALIRVAVRVLKAAFPSSQLVRATERTLSWGVWLATVLWITGLLPVVLTEMEAISWKIGGSPVTLRALVEGSISAVTVLIAALWLSATLEARLMRAESVNISVRKMAANVTRGGLLLVGLLMAMSAAGIPLGALGVLGGAMGVGIGLGLQKLAANYVSGFVILAERSLRIGDVVKVDGFEGRITDITSRYTLIRAQNGRESVVPNEMLITQRVENCTFADPRVALTSSVQVAYGTDVPALTPHLVAAMLAVPRVLPDPAPAVQLTAFAADGLELTLVFWIGDLANGQGNVRSDVNLALLRALTEQGIEIPYPQRVIHGSLTGPAAR